MADPYPDAVVTNKSFFDPSSGGIRGAAVNDVGNCHVNSINTYRGVIDCSAKTITFYNISPVYLGLFEHYTKDDYIISYNPYSGAYFYKMNSSGTYLAQSAALSASGYGLGTTASYGNNVAEDPTNPYIWVVATKIADSSKRVVCRLDYSDMTMTFAEHSGSAGKASGFYATADDQIWLSLAGASMSEFNSACTATGNTFPIGTGVYEDSLLAFNQAWIADSGPTQYLWAFNTTTRATNNQTQRSGAKVLATNGTHIFLATTTSVMVIDPSDYSLKQTFSGTITQGGGSYKFYYMSYNSTYDQLIVVNSNTSAYDNVSFIDLNSTRQRRSTSPIPG